MISTMTVHMLIIRSVETHLPPEHHCVHMFSIVIGKIRDVAEQLTIEGFSTREGGPI